MFDKFVYNKNSPQPLYIQLASHIRALVNSGRLKGGTKLPSRAKLVGFLNVSKSTVSSALILLAQEGILIANNKACYTVSENWRENLPDWCAYIKRAKHKPGVMEYHLWSDADGLTDFAISSDFNLTPYVHEAFRIAFEKIGQASAIGQFSKYGYTPLRNALAEHIKSFGIEAKTENILICQSIIHLLYPLYESLMTGGSNFLYEKANLILTISGVHSIGMNMTPVEMDDYGLSVQSLKKQALKCRYPVLHVDPTDHAPTGIVMSKRRKKELMDFVTTHRIPVVEIDHFRDVWNYKPFPPPLKSMDKNGNVIYIGSFLRCYPFDIQVSWVVADPYIIEHLSDVMVQSGVKASFLNQLAAEELFMSGKYSDMVAAMRGFVSERREKALALCRKYLGGLAQWSERHCNFHFWLNFPEINIRKSVRDLEHNGFYPGYFFEKGDTSHILFCPSSIKEENLENTVRDIAILAKSGQRLKFSSQHLNTAYNKRRLRLG